MSDAPANKISVSVRDVVTFILRSGSIDSAYISSSRMLDGLRIHQKVQKARKQKALDDGWCYESEVRLSHSFALNGFDFTVSGRADGILTRSDEFPAIVEEIKSVTADLETTAEDAAENETHWHWAQAKCYAYFYCLDNLLPDVEIRLTYCHTETSELRELTRSFSAVALKSFFDDLMARYFKWAEWKFLHQRKRDESIQAGGFPYPAFRKGQREFASMVYKTIRAQKNLFAEAPTGTGKTISTLFPAVKSMGLGFSDKIFYLTAKTIARQTAEHATAMLSHAGYNLLSVVITAKDKICPLPERRCNPHDCAYANGHFDRTNDAIWDVITNERQVSRETIADYAARHCICPHELSFDVATWADIIIGDYNYAFDPKASMKRFFGDAAEPGNYTLLVDETHNLIERARDMFSAMLLKNNFLQIRRTLPDKRSALYRALGKVNTCLLEMMKTIPNGQTARTANDPPDDLCFHLLDFVDKADKWLAANNGAEGFPDFLELYFRALDFLHTRDAFDERYTVYIENNGEPLVRLMCLDPSERLAATLAKVNAAIFFSATLTPLPYFRQSIGGAPDDFMCRLPSPFDRENLLVAIDGRISTRYKDRENSYDTIARRLYDLCSAKPGNYFAFFSSYMYLHNVLDRFTTLFPGVETLVQRQNLSEPEREAFLQTFDAPRESPLLAFAVMGGIFSEGIDLVGDKLIGAAIVGVGLPLVSTERDVIAAHYDALYNEGFSYAYMYPGMNKVMQAAGRIIRTETDRGVLLLIDDRFLTARYTELFPENWRHFRVLRGDDSFREWLSAFWTRP